MPGYPNCLPKPYPVMGDGLALDVHGNVYVAVVTRAAVVRIDAEARSQETVATLFAAPMIRSLPSWIRRMLWALAQERADGRISLSPIWV